MNLDHDVCYRIIQARDACYDGKFFTAVTTTCIYCRPICPARTPKKEDVRFYLCAATAEAEGFRPCKRCRPETAPGRPAWNGTAAIVSSALRLVGIGFLDGHSVPQLADRLCMGERHLRRLFQEHLGATPNAIARSRRAHFAAGLLRDTELPLSHVAHSAGFGSVRQFNDVVRAVFGESPRSLRNARSAWQRRQGRGDTSVVVLNLAYRPPLRWEDLVAFLAKRAVLGVEEVNESSYRRSISIGRATGILEVRRGEDRANTVSVRLEGLPAAALGHAVRRVRRMFDLDADPLSIGAHLGRDPRLAPLVTAFPGMRLPLTWEPFEAVVRAVIGQQISVSGAVTLLGRLAERCGNRVDGDGTITRVFPGPFELARADSSDFGIPASRAQTLAVVAQAAHDGRLRLDGSVPPWELEKALRSIPGIGPWSAQYIALRGVGEPDSFPESDLRIRKALDALGYPADRAARTEAIDRLAPWRGYAAVYFWHSLSAGG